MSNATAQANPAACGGGTAAAAMQPGLGAWVSVPRAGRMLGISPQRAHALVDAGLIPAIRPMGSTGQRRVLVRDVLSYRQRCREAQSPELAPAPGEDLLAD
jgi:hypothetical protein